MGFPLQSLTVLLQCKMILALQKHKPKSQKNRVKREILKVLLCPEITIHLMM